MTPKQILDSFSEILMQDERILSAQERALLKNLIQHARSASLEADTHAAVNATIASAVGETVAQRAFSVLGASIVERIVGSSSTTLSHEVSGATVYAGGIPPVPAPPEPPQPLQPGPPVPHPNEQPGPPLPGVLGTTAQGIATAKERARSNNAGKTAVLAAIKTDTAQCLVLDEFLAPQELQELTRFTLEHEADFSAAGVVARNSNEGLINETHRRSRVLMDLDKYRELMLGRIQAAVPQILSRLDMEEFSVTHVEAQITASNDGDFFHGHNDNGDPKVASRALTFVYFFHREPRQFRGGELRLYDLPALGCSSYQAIVPQQNQIVFFPCSVQHEITPVECSTRLFADSRFTLNGWLHQ
jgi:Rps23 Pro-64 3,4-dihydroxylase Tpa1-like proline 4-hydroxylase